MMNIFFFENAMRISFKQSSLASQITRRSFLGPNFKKNLNKSMVLIIKTKHVHLGHTVYFGIFSVAKICFSFICFLQNYNLISMS